MQTVLYKKSNKRLKYAKCSVQGVTNKRLKYTKCFVQGITNKSLKYTNCLVQRVQQTFKIYSVLYKESHTKV